MGRALTKALVAAAGAFLAAIVVLGVIATVTAVAFGIAAAIVSLLVTAAVLAVFLLALIGLGSVLGRSVIGHREPDRTVVDTSGISRLTDSSKRPESWRDRPFESGSRTNAEPTRTDRLTDGTGVHAEEDADPAARLRERYVTGEIDEAEFERRMERLFETSDIEERLQRGDGSRTEHSSPARRRRDRLRDR